jgi:CRISPR/Cas system CMR subunit Cmr6 (Cas7 group RAMP superfamily)
MSKEMKDLKNIKYKSMLLSNSNYNNLSPRETNDVNNINDFLEKEKQTHTNELWSKLDKTIKMQKIRVFVENYTTINNLTAKESKTFIKGERCYL